MIFICIFPFAHTINSLAKFKGIQYQLWILQKGRFLKCITVANLWFNLQVPEINS
jgi:hypothetical protein